MLSRERFELDTRRNNAFAKWGGYFLALAFRDQTFLLVLIYLISPEGDGPILCVGSACSFPTPA